ncbi:hypothetical protein CP488_02071 [Chthonomonas calidirosea]|nr:hypothetical protein CP488_02071 [Chthonomonas calidirosea]
MLPHDSWYRLLSRRPRISKRARLLYLACLLFFGEMRLGASSPPQGARHPRPSQSQNRSLYSLKLRFSEGQVTNYRIDIVYSLRRAGKAQPLYTLRETLMERVQVQKVRPDGSAELSFVVTSGAGLFNGKAFEVNASEAPMYCVVAPNGAVVSSPPSKGKVVSPQMPDFLQRATNLYGLLFPSYPLALGQHWSYHEAEGNTTACLAEMRQVGPYQTLLLKSLSVISIHTFVHTSDSPSAEGDPNSVSGMILRGKLRLRSSTDFAPQLGLCVRIVKHGWADLQVRTVVNKPSKQNQNTPATLVLPPPVHMLATFEISAGIVG